MVKHAPPPPPPPTPPTRRALALDAEPPVPLAVRPSHAALLLDVSERYIRKLVATGELPSFTLGAARLIPYAALQRLPEQEAS